MSEGVILQAHQKAAQAAALEAAAAFERLAGDSHDEWFVTFVHSFYEIDVDSIKNGYPALYLPALQRLKAVIDWHMIGLTQHIATPPEDTPSMANPVEEAFKDAA